MTRAAAVGRTLATLRFFWNSPHGPGPDATGYKGFYYHFLDMETGRRVWNGSSQRSTRRSCLPGCSSPAPISTRTTQTEREIRTLADALYRRADWHWARNGGPTVTHGWRPESGFSAIAGGLRRGADPLRARSRLADTSAPPESYPAWLCHLQVEKALRPRAPLCRSALHPSTVAHLDRLSRHPRCFHARRGIDYFENSRRATYVQRKYAIRNPKGFRGYGENCWGITASDGPGPAQKVNDGRWPPLLRVSGARRAFRSR